MTEAQKKMAEALGLSEQNFQPQEQTPSQRIDILEATTDDIILIVADLIGGM